MFVEALFGIRTGVCQSQSVATSAEALERTQQQSMEQGGKANPETVQPNHKARTQMNAMAIE